MEKGSSNITTEQVKHDAASALHASAHQSGALAALEHAAGAIDHAAHVFSEKVNHIVHPSHGSHASPATAGDSTQVPAALVATNVAFPQVGGAFLRALRLRMTPQNLYRGAVAVGAAGTGIYLGTQVSRSDAIYPTNRQFDFSGLYKRVGTRDLSVISRTADDPTVHGAILDHLVEHYTNTAAQPLNVMAALEDNNSTGHLKQLDTTQDFGQKFPTDSLRVNGEWAKRMALTMPGGCRFLSPEMYAQYAAALDKSAFLKANEAAVTAGHNTIRATSTSIEGQFIMLGNNVVQCSKLDKSTLPDGSELQVARMTTTGNHMLDGHAYWTIVTPQPGGGSLVRMGSFHLGSSNAPLTDRVNNLIAGRLFPHMFEMTAATANMPVGGSPLDWVRHMQPLSELPRIHQTLALLNNYGTPPAMLWRDVWGPMVEAGKVPIIHEISLDAYAKLKSFDDIAAAELTTTADSLGNVVDGFIVGDGFKYSLDAGACLLNTRRDSPVGTGGLTAEQYTAALNATSAAVRNNLSDDLLNNIQDQVIKQFNADPPPADSLFTTDVRDSSAQVLARELFTTLVLKPASSDLMDNLSGQFPELSIDQLTKAVNFAWEDTFLNPVSAPGGLVDSSLQGALLQAQYDAREALAKQIAVKNAAAAAAQADRDALAKQKAETTDPKEIQELQEKLDEVDGTIEKIQEESKPLEETQAKVNDFDQQQDRYRDQYDREREKILEPEDRLAEPLTSAAVATFAHRRAHHTLAQSVVNAVSTVGTAVNHVAHFIVDTAQHLVHPTHGTHAHASPAPHPPAAEVVSPAPGDPADPNNPADPKSCDIYSYTDDGTTVRIYTGYQDVVLRPTPTTSLPAPPSPGTWYVPIDPPSGKHFELYAYNVHLLSGATYSFTGQSNAGNGTNGFNVTIYAQSLDVLGGGSAIIDTSGGYGEDSVVPAAAVDPAQAGTNPFPPFGPTTLPGMNGNDIDGINGNPGAAGFNGGSAGNIQICTYQPVDLTTINFAMNGGHGGVGQAGSSGQQGGVGNTMFEPGNLFMQPSFKAGNGGNGGAGGAGGAGGTGGNAGTSVVIFWKTPYVSTGAGQFGAGGTGGAQGAAGAAGKGGYINYAGIEGGSAQGTDGSPGVNTLASVNGQNGTVPTAAAPNISTTAGKLAFATPVHLKMLLAQVEFQYLVRATLSPLNLKAIQNDANMRYIVNVLAWCKAIGLDDELTPDLDANFGEVQSSYKLMVHRILTGADSYGNGFTYVPALVLDWTTYDWSFSSLQQVQNAKDAACLALQDVKNSVAPLQTELSNLTASFAAEQAKIQAIKDTWPALAQSLPVLHATVTQKQQALTDAIQSVISKIEGMSSNCSWQNICSSIGNTLMMAPGAAESGPAGVAAIVGGGALNLASTFHSSTVPLGAGGDVSTDYLITGLQSIEDATSFANMQEGYKVLGNGAITPDDPGCKKLLVQQAQYEQLYQSYLKQCGAVADRAEAAFQALLIASQAMNKAILEYNRNLALFTKYMLDGVKYASASTTLSGDVSALLDGSPGLYMLVNYFNVAYQQQLMNEVQSLYTAARIYFCLSLTPSQCLSSTAQLQAYSNLNYDVLMNVYNTLRTEYRAYQTSLGYLQRTKATVTVELSQKTHRFLLQDFITNGTVSHTFPPVLSTGTNVPPELNGFIGQADVRVESAEVYLIGVAPPADGTSPIALSIRRNGVFTIVGVDGQQQGFECDPVDMPFGYRVVDKPTTTAPSAYETEVSVDANVKITAALVGPFGGTWTVSVTNGALLNLTTLTALKFKFNVSYRDFTH